MKVETYDDGGSLRVTTNHGEDHDPTAFVDEHGITRMPPISKDDAVRLDGETVDEITAQLADVGFNEDQVEEIVAHFPTDAVSP